MALPNHGRSQSFSTAEEHRQSLSAANSRTLRIVINRPDTARPTGTRESNEEDQQPLSPTLEVPIPHYRIGTFRLSSNGTPVLRGSSLPRASIAASDVTPTTTLMQAEGYVGAPVASSIKAFAKSEIEETRQRTRRDSQGTRSSRSTSTTPSTRPSSVQPEVFDDLTTIYDDPAVVRYCQNVREITAATPARIIAQISSDSFMDYELVSDFFLTFRSYMSTYNVLDLLLARLRWAIGRLEDDGRIIRVRTFAALRHWILNYFMDDFFVDPRLRIRFCAEINRLYADVKASPGNGFSDLKLLRDLKRCWNGRCSLCWNPEDFELDGDQEEDINPGGMIETELPPLSELTARPFQERPESPPTEVLRGPTHSWFEADNVFKAGHDRQQSATSEQVPGSLRSDGSVQASSCFVPTSLLRPSGDNDVYAKGPHPVSVQLRRKNAPSNLQVVTQPNLAPMHLGHRRGASSIDSNRESTPRKPKVNTPTFVVEERSIIRGLLYTPSAPFVQIIPTHSTQSLDRTEVGVTRAAPRAEHTTQSATSAAGRNLFGSLRKVLGSKHGHVDMTLLTVSQSAQDVPMRGQKSQLPLNVSKSHDELRNKAGATLPRKGEIRIDLLSAAVCQNYETKFQTKHRITYGAFFAANPPLEPLDTVEGGSKKARMASNLTRQSGSILIVDDTRPDLPAMSGALIMPDNELNISQTGLATLFAVPGGRGDAWLGRSDSFDAVATQRSSNVLPSAAELPQGSDSVESFDRSMAGTPEAEKDPVHTVSVAAVGGETASPTSASSKTMRNGTESTQYSRPVPVGMPTDALALATESNDEDKQDIQESQPDTSNKLPTQTLRRRPGGDLRRAENVQDLDHASDHHASLDSASVVSGSPHESLIIMNADGGKRRDAPAERPPPNKPVSMINTHSSQHLRPSFEAAVAGFSAIPDDEDGGLEATLMKLEGRYEKRSPPIDQHPLDTTGRRRSLPDLTSTQRDTQPAPATGPVIRSADYQIRETVHEVASEASHMDQVLDEPVLVEVNPTASRRSSIYGLPTESVAGSEESGSLPLLKRDTVLEASPQLVEADQTMRALSVAPGYFPQDPPQLFHLPKGPPPSGNKHRTSIPRPSTANESSQSFLLDEDENLSDLSSEISVDIINYSEVEDRSISPMLAAPGTAISGLEIPAHPLTYASVVNLNIPEIPSRVSDPVPKVDKGSNLIPPRKSPQISRLQNSSLTQPLGRLPAGPAHIPFILACDSQVLAQQMTLVEKSALCEVEWSDLVEMRWDNKTAEILDWVDHLSSETTRGIDLVTARFNLVVKWALSEIVLTQDIHERARVITKYIHVAAHARRLHNYATMLQITLALTSIDCTRLETTWSLVPAPDKSLLKHMEALAQPLRNFHNLRAEMESADLSDGCIPFLGLFPLSCKLGVSC